MNSAASSRLPERVGYIWHDGQFVEGPNATISILTHSLHYGTAVFEGLRVYDKKPFLSKSHFDRLANSAKFLGYALPYSTKVLETALNSLLRKNNLDNGYVRAIAWLGDDALGLMAKDLSVHVALAAWPWPKVHQSSKKDSGITVSLSKMQRPPSSALQPQAKAAGNYLVSTLAYAEARQNGFDDALLCNSDGYLAEASSANLFFVKCGVLHTPKVNGFLDGLTRQTVINLATELGLPLKQENYHPDVLVDVEEVFLTGTAVEIEPITRIDNHELILGPITKLIATAYGQVVTGAKLYKPVTPSVNKEP